MTKQEYAAMLRALRNGIAGQMVGQQKQLPQGDNNVDFHTLVFPANDERQGLQIAYRRRDCYILGYRTTAGAVYATSGNTAIAQGSIDLGFKDDYPNIGWKDKDKTNIVKTIEDLDGALWRASDGKIGALDYGTIAITLAEALRFQDVMMAVVKGTEISGRMVKWDAQVQAGNAVLLSG